MFDHPNFILGFFMGFFMIKNYLLLTSIVILQTDICSGNAFNSMKNGFQPPYQTKQFNNVNLPITLPHINLFDIKTPLKANCIKPKKNTQPNDNLPKYKKNTLQSANIKQASTKVSEKIVPNTQTGQKAKQNIVPSVNINKNPTKISEKVVQSHQTKNKTKQITPIKVGMANGIPHIKQLTQQNQAAPKQLGTLIYYTLRKAQALKNTQFTRHPQHNT